MRRRKASEISIAAKRAYRLEVYLEHPGSADNRRNPRSRRLRGISSYLLGMVVTGLVRAVLKQFSLFLEILRK